MARGGYFIGVKGMEEFVAALEQTADGMHDLDAVHARIGKLSEDWVREHVPVGRASDKDSSTHKPPGYLRSTVLGGHGKWGAWVQMKDESGVLTLQEWGGKSVWKRGASTKWSGTKPRSRSTGYFTVSYKGAGTSHFMYSKLRKPRGYFIWNAGFYLRDEIGRLLSEGIAEVAAKHGIVVDVATGALDIKADGRGPR